MTNTDKIQVAIAALRKLIEGYDMMMLGGGQGLTRQAADVVIEAARQVAALESVATPPPSDELHCNDCGRLYGDQFGFPDLVVPDDVWKRVSPTRDGGSLLCPSCLCERVHDAGLRTRAEFRSGPFAVFASGPVATPPDADREARIAAWRTRTQECINGKGPAIWPDLLDEAVALMRSAPVPRAHTDADEALLSVQIAQECNRLASGYSAHYVINSIRGIVEGHSASAQPVPAAPASSRLREAAQKALGFLDLLLSCGYSKLDMGVLATVKRELHDALAASPEQPAAPDADGKLRELRDTVTREIQPAIYNSDYGYMIPREVVRDAIDRLLAAPPPADAKPSETRHLKVTQTGEHFCEHFCEDRKALRQQVADLTRERDEAHDAIARASERMRAQGAEIGRLRAGQNERAVRALLALRERCEDFRWFQIVNEAPDTQAARLAANTAIDRTQLAIDKRIAALTKASEQEPECPPFEGDPKDCAFPSDNPMTKDDQLVREIAEVLNRHNAEATSNTPDFILAEYLVRCLAAWNVASNARESWYGTRLTPGHVRQGGGT
jgi:hypothetical protein